MRPNTQAAVQSNQQVITSELGISLLKIAFRVSFALSVCLITLIGVWSVACVVGGVAEAGGGLDFIGAWFSAVSGK